MNTSDAQTQSDWLKLESQVHRLFTAAPLSRRSLEGRVREKLYPGRDSEVRLMLRTVQEAAKHIILYGERGLGKTSLANIFWWRWADNLQGGGPLVARIQAYPSDGFFSLWSRALEELEITGKFRNEAGRDPRSDHTSPDTLRRGFEKITSRTTGIVIIDEFDRLRDREAREGTANFLKCLHDYALNITVILIGVANDVSELLAEHKSLRRALSLVKLQRMNIIDLAGILDSRLHAVPLTISDEARTEIVSLACGLPYYVQALGKLAAENVLTRRSLNIQIEDVNAAIQHFLVEGGQLFVGDYDQATLSQQPNNLFPPVILASALAPTDADGVFQASDVAKILNLFDPASACHLRRVQQYLARFTSDRRGRILIRVGVKAESRFRFSDALMQPFVLIRAIKDKTLGEKLRVTLLRSGGKKLEGGGYRLGVAESDAEQLGLVIPTKTTEKNSEGEVQALPAL